MAGCDEEYWRVNYGLAGLPLNPDPWAHFDTVYYGGKDLEGFSNVVFSNGNLDPWSSAGVLESQSPRTDITGTVHQRITRLICDLTSSPSPIHRALQVKILSIDSVQD